MENLGEEKLRREPPEKAASKPRHLGEKMAIFLYFCPLNFCLQIR